MSVREHPAFEIEQIRLLSTLDIINRETALAEDELTDAERELKNARAYDPDKLPVREILYTKALTGVKNLARSAEKPYFTRIDFTEAHKAPETVYIGKYGLTRSDTLESIVVDWRAPLANLYYAGQLGKVNYTAPDGRVECELTLKRQFDIDKGELLSIFDTDIVSQDAYLQSALNAMSSERLKDIVTTIQTEQNLVIRHPLKQSLIVAGAAGSGKTTIALHRIAYLLYAFSEQLSPKNMLILAPNPLFLNYIAGVLPDLGVDEVRQTTFRLLMRDLLGKAMPKIDSADRTQSILNTSDDALSHLTDIAQFKGSLRCMELLDAFLDAYERDYAPEDGISFGPVELYSKEEMDRFLLVDEKPFPMKRRVFEFQKQLQKRASAAAKQLGAWFTRECDRRAQLIRETEKDLEMLKAKLRRLYETRDERIRQAQEQVKPFVKNTLANLQTLEPVELYKLFLTYLSENGGPVEKAAAEHTLTHLKTTKTFESEDVAPLCAIALRVLELPRFDIRHVVIDEAQDFNPFEIALLRKMMPAATFTIVGDLMQGIHAWRGIAGWSELSDGVFRGAASVRNLATSYRNTVEIMNTALKAAKRFPTEGQMQVRPVERHGDKTQFIRFQNRAEQLAQLTDLIRTWKKEGMTTVAVIAKTLQQAKKLAVALPEDLSARLLDANDEEYNASVYVAPASDVKGLEFDGVIMADASEENFPERTLDARLLYVCLTRPLHKLAVLYSDTLTPLLKDSKA